MCSCIPNRILFLNTDLVNVDDSDGVVVLADGHHHVVPDGNGPRPRHVFNVYQSIPQLINSSINPLINQSIINQSTNQINHLSKYQAIHRSNNQLFSQYIDHQPVNLAINQSIKQ